MTDQGPRHGMVQSSVTPGAGGIVAPESVPALVSDTDLAYEAGVEVKPRSQWSYARMRFFRHKMAVVGLVVLIFFGLVAIFAKQIAPYGFDEIALDNINPKIGRAHV